MSESFLEGKELRLEEFELQQRMKESDANSSMTERKTRMKIDFRFPLSLSSRLNNNKAKMKRSCRSP
jgi:hypothetical protein